jgi:hypothetical protein
MSANTTKTQIINDLCEKYPTGPRGRIRKDHYVQQEQWVSEYARYKQVHVLAAPLPFHGVELNPFFGYNPVDLYKLEVRTLDAAKDAVRGRRPGESQQALTRRARLLWSRMRPAIEHVKKTGTTGAWCISFKAFDWGHPLRCGLYFHADTAAGAEAQARFIAPMLGASPEMQIDINFHDIITPDEASRLNGVAVNRTLNEKLREIAGLETRLKSAREAAETLRETAGKMMGAVMLLNTEEEPDAGEKEAE